MRISPIGEFRINNVFLDCGFAPAEAEDLRIRARMMIALTDYIRSRKMRQSEAATTMAASQSRISDLMRGKIGSFTIDTHVNMLTSGAEACATAIDATGNYAPSWAGLESLSIIPVSAFSVSRSNWLWPAVVRM
jgi:predicted XRE-type DNA-binding protein